MKVKGIILLLFTVTACQPQLTDDPIPIVAFNDVVINLSLPAYQKIRVDGGMMAYNGAGIRGIIIYRVNANVYRAYERNCSYHPNDASATVDIDASNLFFKDYSCGSQFTKENGTPSGGPAWRPLRQYQTQLSGSILTITSDPIN